MIINQGAQSKKMLKKFGGIENSNLIKNAKYNDMADAKASRPINFRFLFFIRQIYRFICYNTS